MIAIVDYGMGNLRSVVNAFRAIGEEPRLISDPGTLGEADAIVLPGVGAFAEGMARLEKCGMRDVLERAVRREGKPFLGLCLGMQLMASESIEHGSHAGLDWISGSVQRLPETSDGAPVRVPHVGWNDLEVIRRDGLLRDVSTNPTFYYVHSYYLEAGDPEVVSAYTTHGARFAAVVEHENLFGTQFHPEKSQVDGLALLRSFAVAARRGC